MIVYLAELRPANAVTGVEQVLRFSSNPQWTRADSLDWSPMLAVPLRRNTQIFDGAFQSQPDDYGQLEFAVSRGQSISPLTAMVWDGRPVKIWKGQPGQNTSAMTLIFDGTSESVSGTRSRVVVKLVGPNVSVPLLTQTYAGTGGAEGPSELKGRPKPLLLGSALNLEPVYINRALGIFQYHSYGAAGGVTGVFDSGSQLGTSIGDFATYALLAAATIPAGRYATCNAAGLARHGGDITGVLTIDAVGAVSSGLPGAIIKWVLLTHLGLAAGKVKSDSLDWLDGQIPYAQDIYVTDQITAEEFLARVMLSLGGYTYWLDDGRFTIGLIRRGGSSVATINQLNIAETPRIRETRPPVWKRSQGWGRCWRVHSFSEVRTPKELNPRGTWSASPSPVYQYYDMVEWANATWVYVATLSGNTATPGTDSTVWQYFRSNGAAVVESATTPTDPQPGVLWRNPTNGQLRSYIGGSWILVSDVTGLNTAAAIAGQAWAATNGSQTIVDNRYAMIGANSCVNSDFTTTLVGWTIGGTQLAGSNFASGRNMVGYSGRRNVMWSQFWPSSGNYTSDTWFFGPLQDGSWAGNATKIRRFGLPVRQGDRIFARGLFSIHGGDTVNLRVRFWNDSGTLVGESDVTSVIGDARLGGPSGANGEPTNFAEISGFWTAPSGATHATWNSWGTAKSGSPDVYLFVTEPMLARVPAGQFVGAPYVPGPADRASDATPENTAAAIAGQGALATVNAVDPRTSQVLATGSIPATIPDNSFTYTSDTSSVTITWPTMTLYRVNGNTITISSGSQTITGLSASTTYKVYPYVVDNGGTSGSISFVTGGSGSPAIMHPAAGSAAAAATMWAQSNIPMGGFVVATPASGSGGGGGGGSNCLHPETLVKTPDGEIECIHLRTGDRILTPNGFRSVSVSLKEASEWVKIKTNSNLPTTTTRSHIFYRATGEHVRADELKLGDLIKARGNHEEVVGLELVHGLATLVVIDLEEPHLYYAGRDSLLSHNNIAKP